MLITDLYSLTLTCIHNCVLISDSILDFFFFFNCKYLITLELFNGTMLKLGKLAIPNIHMHTYAFFI